MLDIKVEKNGPWLRLGERSGYGLILLRPGAGHWKVSFDLRRGEDTDYITARDLPQYAGVRPDLLRPEWQYIEVGAGLGEFVPYIVRTFGAHTAFKRPIVIDPAPYGLLEEMLTIGRSYAQDDVVGKRVEELIERCSIIRDPAKVTLINLRLRDAVSEKGRPDILGTADVVVDNEGGARYWRHDGWDRTSALAQERLLLKPDGQMLGSMAPPPLRRRADDVKRPS